MKIVQVEIFDIEYETELYYHPVLVRLTTDEGVTGVGEVGLAYGTGHSGGAGYAKNIAESFILGADPFKTEMIWEKLFRSTFWALGGGPVVFGGMSAFDIAFWDIKGKALGLPVHQLLGGKTNETLRAYASQIQFGWDPVQVKSCARPEEYAAEAVKAVGEGYDCVKVDPILFDENGKRARVDTRKILTNDKVRLYYERVKAIREAVGPDVDIIIELHSAMSASTAIQMGRLWEEFNCFYFEEPSNYLNAKVQEKVAENVKIPMAGGERIYTRWGYRPYFEGQSLDVIQPDLCLVGGITEGKKVCDYAHLYDITVQCHVCGSPVSKAAALQLEAVIPNFLIHEHHTMALKDFNIQLCKQNYQPEKGRYAVPDLPGLGIDLDDAVVNKSPKVVLKKS